MGFPVPVEDLRPVSEVEAGVNFRPAGGVREQVAGSTSQEATRHRNQASQRRVWSHTSLHPEVPGIQFVSPGRGLDIRAIDGLDEGV